MSRNPFPLARFFVVAFLVSLPVLLIVASVHDTPARVTEVCLDLAGRPGIWDCELGHRVIPVVRPGEIGSGIHHA